MLDALMSAGDLDNIASSSSPAIPAVTTTTCCDAAIRG